MKNLESQKGISILGVLVLGALLILILSYFNISIKAVVESPTGQENVNYVKGSTESLWVTYLQKPAHYLWNDVWLNIFWRPFIYNMERLRDGKPTDLDKAGENLRVKQNN